ICCVGDDDQSIYSWRGAEVANILRFEIDFPGALVVRLEENYRSTPEILAAADGVIANNQGRPGKTLWTRAEGGDKVAVRGLWDAEQEARWAVEEVEAPRHLIAGDGLPRAARTSLAAFIASLDRWREMAAQAPHTDLVHQMLDESGYTGMLQADKSPDAPGRLENLKELVVAMAEFENLGGFLEHVSLVMDNAADSAGDMVNLMTLHSAKGLEFDTVFLPGWEEGLFPSIRSVEEHGLKGLEEERRLAYVGLTRARHRA